MAHRTQSEKYSEQEIVSTEEKVTALAEGLRSLATYLESERGNRLVALMDLRPGSPLVELEEYFYQSGDFTAAVKSIGVCDKTTSDYYFNAERFFGPYIRVKVQASRQAVCNRKQVGVEKVTRKQPDPNVPLIEVTEDRPIYEYDCPPSFLASESE
jgi:hypothetical protein